MSSEVSAASHVCVLSPPHRRAGVRAVGHPAANSARAPPADPDRRGAGGQALCQRRSKGPLAGIRLSTGYRSESRDGQAVHRGQPRRDGIQESSTAAASVTWRSRPICTSRSRSAGRAATQRWSGSTVACTETGDQNIAVREGSGRARLRRHCPEYRGSTGYGKEHQTRSTTAVTKSTM